MKVKIKIECSPEEARSFLGLPDVGPLQARLVEQMEARMGEAMAGADPEAMVKSWMEQGMTGFEQMQKTWLAAGGKDKK
jgi:hypothetical protein